MEVLKQLQNGHRCQALGLDLSEDTHDLLAPTWGFQTWGSATGCSLPGGTAALPPRLLIIHPVQLDTADKSHEIAFVLQLDDLHFTGVHSFLHVTHELSAEPTAGGAVRILGGH